MTAPDRPTAPETGVEALARALALETYPPAFTDRERARDNRDAERYAGEVSDRLTAKGWALIRRDVVAQALDRMETTFNLMHPGELTDDERHGMAQHMWFGMEELRAALQEPSDAR